MVVAVRLASCRQVGQSAAVSGDAAKLLLSYYNITPRGNFEEHTTVLHVTKPLLAVAKELGIAAEDAPALLAKGRKARRGLKCGICGEHGGEPSSVKFCYGLGLNYVSCSPFRVPVARLAAAQAALA